MKIVVVGHGMVGHKFLESLAETGITGAEVTVLCEEPRAAYDRVHLSEFFSGKSAEELSLVEPGFFERTGFTLRLNRLGNLRTAGCRGCFQLWCVHRKFSIKITSE